MFRDGSMNLKFYTCYFLTKRNTLVLPFLGATFRVG